jgi:hypothetical protein
MQKGNFFFAFAAKQFLIYTGVTMMATVILVPEKEAWSFIKVA